MEIADRIVLFHRQGGRLARQFSFQAQGRNRLKFLLADVAEGAWQIWRDGQICQPAVAVSAEAGALYFEGRAGTYTLWR